MKTMRNSLGLAGLALSLASCESAQPLAPDAPTPSFSHASGVAMGRAQLHPVNQSGVKGVITFVDDGNTLQIMGTARGLDPAGVYASLIYDSKSVPGGPLGCEPAIFDPTDPGFLLPTMFVGFWSVDQAGVGILDETDIADDANPPNRVRVPLGKFKSVSIRDLNINGGFGPTAIVACGEVAIHPAG